MTVPGQVVDVACGVDHMVALAKSLMWRVAGWRDGQRAADPGAGRGRAQRQLLPAGGDGPPAFPATHTDSTNSLLQHGQFKETFTQIFLCFYFYQENKWGGRICGTRWGCRQLCLCILDHWRIGRLERPVSSECLGVLPTLSRPTIRFLPWSHGPSPQLPSICPGVKLWCLVVVLRHHSRMDGGSVFHLC